MVRNSFLRKFTLLRKEGFSHQHTYHTEPSSASPQTLLTSRIHPPTLCVFLHIYTMVKSLHEDALEIQMMSDDPTLLCKTVGDPSSVNLNVLNFLFLGCEPQMPYGPVEHTASLMMDLLAQALTEASNATTDDSDNAIASPGEGEAGTSSSSSSNKNDSCWMLRMKMYNVQKQEYPSTVQEWDSYDGIILPGSFSAAYDDEPWIRTLCEVIQTEIVAKRRKTLGKSCTLVCRP